MIALLVKSDELPDLAGPDVAHFHKKSNYCTNVMQQSHFLCLTTAVIRHLLPSANSRSEVIVRYTTGFVFCLRTHYDVDRQGSV